MVLVRRPGLLVSADNAMRCDAMLATSRSCNNARHSADGPATVYDVRASSVVHSLDRRARLVLAFRSQRVRRKPISRMAVAAAAHGDPRGMIKLIAPDLHRPYLKTVYVRSLSTTSVSYEMRGCE
jgi:hypothetical protein